MGVGPEGPSLQMPKIEQQSPKTLEQAAKKVASIIPRPYGILVVEDDPDTQWHLARMLTVSGHRVVGTSSGDGALALIEQWKVDLVLVAEELPGMDGIDLAKILRDRYSDIPVVLMSENGPDIQVAARLAGAVACLTKPFRLETLRDLLETLKLDTALADGASTG